MKFPLVCLGAAAALTLAACGDRATDMSVPDIPDLPLQTPLQAYQAPIVPLQTTIHVGADVARRPTRCSRPPFTARPGFPTARCRMASAPPK